MAVQKAMAAAAGSREIAVIGAGALGLTSATLLQRAGAKVTIYAKERAPYTRSSRATGGWTPDSRVSFASKVAPSFPALWEEMARSSWTMYQSYLGMSGYPIEYTDRYSLFNPSPQQAGPRQEPVAPDGTTLDFARYQDRIRDITPRSTVMPPGSHPFPYTEVRRNTSLTFNVADYSRQLLTDFLIEGGKIEAAEFHAPGELAALPQKVVINCTGYGARALWKDESLVPVRGQIAWLIPQPEVNYGLQFGNLNILARRDGIVVQSMEQGEASGWNDSNESPDRGEADRAVQALAAMYTRMGTAGKRASA
jgi:glycine/D-amino acid oxidase-like deaminating enzyme